MADAPDTPVADPKGLAGIIGGILTPPVFVPPDTELPPPVIELPPPVEEITDPEGRVYTGSQLITLIGDILAEHNGMESNIPISDAYWIYTNLYRSIPRR